MDENIFYALLAQTKTALRISEDNQEFDDEIIMILQAAYRDLEATAGVNMDGFFTDEKFDPLILRAILTYTRMHFGEPSNYDDLKASYKEQKAQLLTCSGYGLEEF